VYLEAALKASNVRLTPPILSYSSKECIEYGNRNNSDLNSEACVNSNITINLNGLNVIKASKGIFLIKNVELIVEGNIKREYVNINAIRRQDREAILSLLPTNPRQIKLPVKSGIIPSQVVEKLKPYITP
jgi:alpha-galactosidase/6-phospho-beta-glucosidase family protein